MSIDICGKGLADGTGEGRTSVYETKNRKETRYITSEEDKSPKKHRRETHSSGFPL
jgi:hypothetical protein